MGCEYSENGRVKTLRHGGCEIAGVEPPLDAEVAQEEIRLRTLETRDRTRGTSQVTRMHLEDYRLQKHMIYRVSHCNQYTQISRKISKMEKIFHAKIVEFRGGYLMVILTPTLESNLEVILKFKST